MKKYNLITLIMGLSVSLFLYFTRVLDSGWIIIITLIPIANYALSVFSRRITGISKKLIYTLLIIISIIINISFLASFTICIINLPPDKAAETEIKPIPSDPNGEKIFNQLQPLFAEFNKKHTTDSVYNIYKKYANSNVPIDSKILTIISNTKTLRKSIIDILSTNTFYIINPSYQKDDQTIEPQSNKGLLNFFRLDLIEIKYLFTTGQRESALTKYHLLWNSSINLLDCKNPNLINSLIAKTTLDLLMDFYNNNKRFFPENYLENLNFNSDILIRKLEASREKGFNSENLSVITYLKSLKYKWPFLDYNKTAKKVNERFSQLIKDSKLDSKPENSENDSDLPYGLSVNHYLFNPIGTYYYLQNISIFTGINDSLYETKDKIRMLAK
ncbi:MAG: hypothetical protein Q8942_19655 [Bacillota bacterium]|nr:hypothetical protein [Bacillota bacterium]